MAESNLKLNLSGKKNGIVQLSPETSKILRNMNLKLHDYLDPVLLGMEPHLKLKIQGGSSQDGCPMLALITTRSGRIFDPKRNKKVKRESKFVTERTSVLDVLVK